MLNITKVFSIIVYGDEKDNIIGCSCEQFTTVFSIKCPFHTSSQKVSFSVDPTLYGMYVFIPVLIVI